MAERLVSVPLFQDTLMSGTVTSAAVTSAIYLGKDVLRAETLMFQVSSVLSRADIGFFYAVSPDGVTFGSFADNTALVPSSVSFDGGTQSAWKAAVMPNMLAPYVKFAASGTGSNATDARIWATLVLRMN